MFISYFEPIYLRDRCDLLIHYFYKQLRDYGTEEVIYLTNEDFWHSIEDWLSRKCWNLSRFAQRFHEFTIPSNETLKRAKKEIIPLEIFDDLLKMTSNNKFQAEKILLTEPYVPLVQCFEKIFEKLVGCINIEGIFTTKNCPSLEVVAKKYNIPVIHYEIAGLRPYNYQFLAYYDYSGVNGNTSATIGYNEFSKEYDNNKFKLLSNNKILKLLSRNNFKYKKVPKPIHKYKIGAALQIYNDSNLIAFSNGYTSEKLIDLLCSKFDIDDIIIRNHPSTVESKLLSFKNIDHSKKAVEFINKCEKIITINSSVAFEAALYGKPVFILGQSPYEILSEDLNDLNKKFNYKDINTLERKKKINYLTFVYMIPYELLFDLEYIRYRLSNPKLTDLYKYHLSYYKEKYKKLPVEKVNLLQQIFSVKNKNNHKVLRLLGFKIKFKRKKKNVKKLKYSH